MVRRAIHVKTRRQVAIKTLRVTDTDLANMLEREYKLLQRLAPHPNLINAIEFHNFRGEVALVLDFFAGTSLQVLVNDQKRLLEIHVHGLCALFQAVQHLHRHGVIHRDIKPHNVLISGCFEDVRLIDFNTAASLEDGEPLTPAGTPLYKPPEALMGQASCKASDIWASGMCIFFAISGQLPQGRHKLDPSARINEEVALQRVSFDDPVWQTVSQDCKRMLERCLFVDREGRPTIEEVLEEPWVAGDAPEKGIFNFLGQGVPAPEAWFTSLPHDALKICVEVLKSLSRAFAGQGWLSPRSRQST
jgi:serine/threonine protein kinase